MARTNYVFLRGKSWEWVGNFRWTLLTCSCLKAGFIYTCAISLLFCIPWRKIIVASFLSDIYDPKIMVIVWPLFATFALFVLPTSYQFESFAALPLHFVSKVNYLEKVKMKHTKVKPRYLWACTSDVIWFTDWSKLVIVRNCNKGLEWNHCSTLSPKIQMISKNSLKSIYL